MLDATKELNAENAENAEKELDIKFKTKNYKLNSAVSACSAVKKQVSKIENRESNNVHDRFVKGTGCSGKDQT